MPDTKKLIQTLKEYGAHHAAGVAVSDIRFYPELRASCEMNRCGCYDTNWCCPPGCGDVPTLARSVRRFSHAVAFQYIGKLADSFDFEGMLASNEAFNKIAHKIQDDLQKETLRFLVLGAGTCTLCKNLYLSRRSLQISAAPYCFCRSLRHQRFAGLRCSRPFLYKWAEYRDQYRPGSLLSRIYHPCAASLQTHRRIPKITLGPPITATILFSIFHSLFNYPAPFAAGPGRIGFRLQARPGY